MFSIAIIARNRVEFDIWRHSGVECGARGEKRETHGESRKAKRVAAWLHELRPQDATVLTS
jgi:hypothetical protein